MIPCPCLGKQHYCLPHLYFVVNRILLSWYMFQSWIFHFKEISVCTGSAPTSSEHSSQNCMKGHFSGYGPWVSLNIYSNFSMYCLLRIFIRIAQFSWRKKLFFTSSMKLYWNFVSYLIMTCDQWVHIIRNAIWYFLAEARASPVGHLLKNLLQCRRP